MCLFNTAYVLGYKFYHTYVDTTLTAVMFVVITHRITGLHYTYGCSTLRAAYVCELYRITCLH